MSTNGATPAGEDAADEDTLAKRVNELEQHNTALEARVQALENKLENLTKILGGEAKPYHIQQERGDDEANVLARLDQLETDIEAVDDATQTAIGLATASPETDHGEKTSVAKTVARNKLVKARAEVGQSYSKAELTNRQVREMAEPEHDLAWQIVDNAWTSLTKNWECFEVDDSGEEKTLVLTETPPKPLVKAVERDLGRDDLAKSFFGEKLPQGHSERGV